MPNAKRIHVGTYLLGAQAGNTSFGRALASIQLPDYTKEIFLYLDDSRLDPAEQYESAQKFCFNLEELEGMHAAIGRLIHDLRKMESLSRKGLLRDEAYCEDND